MNLEFQSRHEGLNNEEQGGAIGKLFAREPPGVQVDLYFPDDESTETTGSLSRPGLTAEARAEKPGGLNNAYLARQGVLSLKTLWAERAHLR